MRADDEAAFREVFAGRVHSLRRTAYLLTGDWQRADDLTQTAFIRLYSSWTKVRDKESVDGYLRTVLIRAWIDEGRRPHRREQLVAELPEVVAPAADSADERAAMLSALRQVPPRQRACLVLRFYDDLSVLDAAAALGCTEGTVKSQTARGLAALRQLLGDEHPMLQET